MSVRSSDGNTDFSAWDPSEVPFDAEREAREQLAIAKASEMSGAAARTIEASILALHQSGVPLDQIEIVSVAGRPEQWRVRQRRALCDCGRGV